MAFGRIKRGIVFAGVNYFLKGLKQSHCKTKNVLLRWYGFSVGEGTRIVGPVDISGHLTTGKDVFIGKDLKIHGNGSVYIQDNCDLAPNVTFLTGTHEVGMETRRAGQGLTLDIEVGAGTWIGACSIILPGIKIGQGCVIGAGSLVNKDVPDNVIVAGVPARVIKELEPLTRGKQDEIITN